METERESEGLIELVAAVGIFGFVMVLILMMLFVNMGADNSLEQEISTTVHYQAEQIATRSIVTNIMVDKMWRTSSVSPGTYGNMSAYRVISRFLASDPGESVWTPGGSVPYSNAEQDMEDYLTTKVENLYGNTGYRVRLYDESGQQLEVENVPPPAGTFVEYPIALPDGQEGKIKMRLSGEEILSAG